MGNNTVVGLFLVLGIMILAARIVGSLARRFQQPRVLGELIVGVILGPTVLNLLHSSVLGLDQTSLNVTVQQFAQLGVLLLMFNIGLEVHLSELMKVGRIAGIAGIVGGLLPVVIALPVVMLFGKSWQAALFAGVTLAATSVSISAQVLLELGVLRTRVGNALLATALIDDVIAVLLVSLATAITGVSSFDPGTLVLIVVKMVAYLVIAFGIAWFILPRIMDWVHLQPDIAHSYGVPALALGVMLLFGWSAEHLGGVAAITSAFIVGLGLSRTHDAAKHQIATAIANLAYAFLVPIFFVNVGLQTDLRSFPLSALPLAASLLVIAVGGKILGCGWGAMQAGFNRQEALQLGMCMVARGEVSLIVASLGLSSGIFRADDPLFTSLFLVILLTTVLTPLLVRRVVPHRSITA